MMSPKVEITATVAVIDIPDTAPADSFEEDFDAPRPVDGLGFGTIEDALANGVS